MVCPGQTGGLALQVRLVVLLASQTGGLACKSDWWSCLQVRVKIKSTSAYPGAPDRSKRRKISVIFSMTLTLLELILASTHSSSLVCPAPSRCWCGRERICCERGVTPLHYAARPVISTTTLTLLELT